MKLANAGTIVSTINGQAIDFDAVSSTAPGAIQITNLATGVITSTDADAIRPGEGAIIDNYGSITAGGVINTSSDGIDFQSHSGTVINEVGGTITGARHGITTDGDVNVTNYGTIIGSNGSGVGSDGTGTVYNYGTITGAYNGSGKGDGDGVDIDGKAYVYNNGTIQGTGAAGLDAGGNPNTPEGLALSYGTVYNDTNGSITSAGVAVNFCCSTSEASQVTDKGSIYGDNYGIGLYSDGTILNYGSIGGGNQAIIADGAISITNYGTLSGGDYGLDILTTFHSDTSVSIDNYGIITGGYGALLIQSGASVALTMEQGASLQGVISLDGALKVIENSDYTFSGAIAGVGSLTKSGSATLTLTGANSYTGGTTVAGGTLRGSTTSLQGPILDNGTVEFAQDTAGVYSNAISGSGALVKSGTGLLSLTGVSAIGGSTTVSGGTLAINGTLATSGLTVTSGATLAGAGTITGAVTIANGAVLSPGNSPGTLTVNGNLTLASGARTVIDIDGATWSAAGGAGSYDRLVVNGTFTAAGTLTPQLRGISGAATNSYVPTIGTRYTIVTANAVTGTFASVEQPSTGLDGSTRLDALYIASTVQLVVTPKSFATLGAADGWNANTLAVAGALDTVRSGSGSAALFNNLYGMDAAGYGLSFSQMSGQLYADALQGFASAAHATLGLVREQALHEGVTDPRTGTGMEIWTRFLHTRESPGDSALGNAYSATTDGFVAGVTLISEPALRFGVAGGYTHTRINTGLGASAGGSGEVGYLYGANTPNPRFALTAVGGIANGTLHASRAIATQGASVSADGSAHSFMTQFAVDARFRGLQTGALALYCIAGIEAGLTRSSQIDESASISSFALTLPRSDWNTMDGRLGGEALLHFKGIALSAYGNWLIQLGDAATASRQVVLGEANWAVRSTGLARSGVGYGAAISAQVAPRLSLQASYDGADRGKGYHSDRLSAGVSMAF